MSVQQTATVESDGGGETDDTGTARATAAGGGTELDVPAVCAIIALVLVFWAVVGLPGLIGGIATAVVWHALGSPYAVAFGHVALVICVPTTIDPTSFAIVEAGFVALLLASAPQTAANVPIRYAAAALASAGTLAGLAWFVLALAGQPLWVAAVAMLTAVAGGMYGIHRYALVIVLERRATDRGESHQETTASTDESTTVTDATDGEQSLSDRTIPDTEP